MSDIPTITPLSTPTPNRQMQDYEFVPAADRFVAEWQQLSEEMALAIPWMDLTFQATAQAKADAQQAVTDAQEQAGIAAGHAAAAGDAAALAEDHKNTSQAAAAAAQAAAGLPAIAGKAGFGLVVKPGEDGVEWQPVGETIGTINVRSSEIEADWLPLDGKTYAQADYPALFAVYPQWAYDLATKQSLPALNDDANDCAATPDGGLIFVVGNFTNAPKYLRVIDTTDFSEVSHSFPAVESDGKSVDVDPSGQYLAVASYTDANDGTGSGGLFAVDVNNPGTLLLGPGFDASTLVRFSPNGARLLAIIGNAIHVFSVPDFTLIGVIDDKAYQCASWSPGGDEFAATASDSSLTIFDVSLNVRAASIIPYAGSYLASGMAWAGDMIYVATLSNGELLYLFSSVDLSPQGVLSDFSELNRGNVFTVSTSSDEKYLCVGDSGFLEVFELPNHKKVFSESTRMGYRSNRFIGDDQFLMAGDNSSPYYELRYAKSPTEFTVPAVEPLGVGTEFKVRSQVTANDTDL